MRAALALAGKLCHGEPHQRRHLLGLLEIGVRDIFQRATLERNDALIAVHVAALVAVQVLVTVAVLPAVVSDLGSVRLFGAALAASQVATVVVLPFTPRLVTRWGLRGAFHASLGAFVAGSFVVISAADSWMFVAGLALFL